MPKWVYSFGDGKAEGSAAMRTLLGGKGANLAEMSAIGLPVPPGFTITTEVCTHYYANERRYPAELQREVAAALAGIETKVGARLDDPARPLLVSVRSGARASMPGMMDTVLNLGLNDATVAGLAAASGNPRFAWDSYRRFIQMFGDVVLGLPHNAFESILDELKDERGAYQDTELDAAALQDLAGRYKAMVVERMGQPFPEDPKAQLWAAIGAVFGSWMNDRAVTYRRLHDIPASWGTAVNVQAMVFGNMGEDCATGVAFTRDPATGENRFYGEYLVNAQGEDVVAGIRTPRQITLEGKRRQHSDEPAMEEAMPAIYAQLAAVRATLERHYREMQDIEFTVQRGKLWMLQTRNGKRTTQAALKIAVDFVKEGLIDTGEALTRIEPQALNQLLHPTIDPGAAVKLFARGLPASPGAASGAIVFSADEAEKRANAGDAVILVRMETSPEDVHGMHAAKGILTTRGGMTSHAAVVARGWGRPCVVGAGEIRIDPKIGTMSAAGVTLRAGDRITIDGAAGTVMIGEVPMIQPRLGEDFATLMGWADETRRLGIRANADTPEDARVAREFGAEGIGLCRTEHMFFDDERIVAMRQMIVAADEPGRRAALAKLLPMQRQDFIGIFAEMRGRPVTIRLLDPPLHEFLPHGEAELAEVAKAAGVPVEELRKRALALVEANPMLGHRGCRLAISYPEIAEMQARAIIEAAIEAGAATGAPIVPEIMIPLVATRRELEILKAVIDRTAAAVMAERRAKIDYTVGTMIELPRAALRAGELAEAAAFFSFGTNDLTQTTYGLSRDDVASVLKTYLEREIFAADPFATLDVAGVGELIRIGAERGRAARRDLKLGICGEHGGDPASIAFCESVGLDYVSCSPYRVPIARLAAAQAALARRKGKPIEAVSSTA
jgi:pyruvate,orthophosphate dikinase